MLKPKILPDKSQKDFLELINLIKLDDLKEMGERLEAKIKYKSITGAVLNDFLWQIQEIDRVLKERGGL